MFTRSSNVEGQGSNPLNNVTIPVLKKKDRYVLFNEWSDSIESALLENNLWDAKKKCPAEGKDKAVEKKIRLFLRNHLDEELKGELIAIEDAATLFRVIKSRFTEKKESDGRESRRAFHSLKAEGKSINKLISEIERLTSETKICLEENISLKDKLELLETILPIEYGLEMRAISRDTPGIEYLWQIQQRLEAIEKVIVKTTQPKPEKPQAKKSARDTKPKTGLVCTFHPEKDNHTTEDCYMTKALKKVNYVAVAVNDSDKEDQVRKLDKNNIYYSIHILGNGELSETEYIMDSGASFHITYSNKNLKNIKNIKREFVTLPDGSNIQVSGVGTLELPASINGNPYVLTLSEVRYIPELKVNLMSEIALAEEGYTIVREGKKATILKDDQIVGYGLQRGGSGSMYHFEQHHNPQANTVKSISLQTAHETFGHPSPDRIIEMAESGKYGFKLTDKKFMNCDACSAAKLTTPSQPSTCSRVATTAGEIVNADVVGPLNEINPEAKYVSVLIDRSTNYASIDCMNAKDPRAIAGHIEKFITEIRHPIQSLRSDNGTEYKNNTVHETLLKNKIRSEFTAPHSPAQNGKAERFNRTLIEMTKSMLKSVPSLAAELWPYALDYACWLYNRLPQKDHENLSPYERLLGHTPDLSNCKPFGTECWYNDNPNNKTKAEDKGKPGIYLGNAPNSDAHLVLTEDDKVITSRIVKFSQLSMDLTNTHEKFYVTEKRRKMNEELKSDSEEEHVPKGTKSRPSSSEQVPTGYAYLVKAVEENNLSLSKLLIDPVHGEAWKKAAQSELDSLASKNTFHVVEEIPENATVIKSKWICKEKLGPNNEVIKHKARLVGLGYAQRQGENFDDTLAPVTDITEITTTLAMAASRRWPVHQIDVKTAYLNAPLHHDVYMRIPYDTPDEKLRGKTVKLEKALYGLKQAGFEWFQHLKSKLNDIGWTSDDIFPCRYIRKIGNDIYYLLVYVDDMIITGPKIEVVNIAKEEIARHFEIEDSEDVNFLLGMRIERDENYGAFRLDQEAMITRILDKFNITGKCRTPCSRELRHLPLEPVGAVEADLTEYQSKIGSLMFIARYTRPEISYPVAYLARFSHAPKEPHMKELNRILMYLNATKEMKFTIAPKEDMSTWEIEAFADADYADHCESTESTSGSAIYLNGALIAWGTGRQKCTSLSTTESEYIALSNTSRRVQIIDNFLKLSGENKTYVILRCDNQSTLKSVEKTVVPPKLKHIDVRMHHVRDRTKIDGYKLIYIKSEENVADVFTKGLGKDVFMKHRHKLNVN